LVIERDVYIINWEALRAHSRLQPFGSIRLRGCSECETGSTRKPHLCEREDRELNEMPFATIIADEVHRAKNPTAIQTRALKSAADSTRFRFGLSATPVGNSVGDLWSVMNLLAPEEWASRPKWVDRYCNKVPNWFGGVGSYDIAGLKQETTEELMRFLEPRMLGRTREQVLTHVPETMYDLRVVKMDAAQMKLYKAMKKERLVALDGELLAATNPAVANMRLVQLASSTLEMDLGTGKVFLKEPSVKVDALVELADERQGAPTVVFAESSKLIRLVSNRFEREHIKHYVIDGDEDANARDIAQQEFQTGNVPFILCTIGAGKEGLTLTAADTLVYLQQSYSYIGMSQSRDRIAGIAQVAEKVTIITYVTEGTVEENYSCVLTEKERQDLETSRDPNLWRKVIEGV
jgi:SNF2 family DNA or RNA helicase